MKNILFLFTILFGFQTVSAQVDRSKYPNPAPAREIKLGEVSNFTLDNGLKVFVVENRKLPRVSFSLVFDRDPILEGDKAGMLDVFGEMLKGGTANRTKDQLDEEIDFIGASLSASSTSLSASGLKKHQEKILELMNDVLMNPVFPDSELEKLKKQSISNLAASKEDPGAISSRLTTKLNFGTGHPYGEIATETTVSNVTVEDVKKYYSTFFKPNIGYLAIVGDINAAEARQLVDKYFKSWQKAQVPTFTYTKPSAPVKSFVALVDRPASVQSVLNVTFPVDISLSNPDYIATRVMNYILGGGASSRLFLNLREDKGFTYGSYSSMGVDKLITSFSATANVKTEVTEPSVTELLKEIQGIWEKGVTESELEAAKASLSGSFGRSLERPATIANFAISTERYGLPKDFYATYLQQLNNLTVADVNAVAKKYLTPDQMYITVVGKASEIEEKLKAFGEVKKFNNMGDPEKLMSISSDATPETIFNKYFQALGGVDKVSNIKTLKSEAEGTVQGIPLNMVMAQDEKAPAFVNKITGMGMVLSNTLYKEGKVSVSAMGAEQELDEETAESIKIGVYIFPELHFSKLGYDLKLEGIKEVEGEMAYQMVVSKNGKQVLTNYYSVNNGLKIKMEDSMSGNAIAYKNYQEKNGILFPMTSVISSPMATIESKVKNIEVNPDLTASDF
jgi:zinc protease